MSRIVLLCLLILLPGALSAQGNRQTPPPGGFSPLSSADSLRAMIQDRFSRQVRQQLGLTEAESDRMRGTLLDWFIKRHNLGIDESRLKSSLAYQMRPGVAADQDSVAKLMDALLLLKVRQAQTYRDELKDLSYLTPLQRAQFFLMRERLLEAIQNAREENVTTPERRRPRPR